MTTHGPGQSPRQLVLNITVPFQWAKNELEELKEAIEKVAKYAHCDIQFLSKKKSIKICGNNQKSVNKAEWLITKKISDMVSMYKKVPDYLPVMDSDSETEGNQQQSSDCSYGGSMEEERESFNTPRNGKEVRTHHSSYPSSDSMYEDDSEDDIVDNCKVYEFPVETLNLRAFFISPFGENWLHMLTEQTQAEFKIENNNRITIASEDPDKVELGYQRLSCFVDTKLSIKNIRIPISLFHYPLADIEQQICFVPFPQLIPRQFYIYNLKDYHLNLKLSRQKRYQLYLPITAIKKDDINFTLSNGMTHPDILNYLPKLENKFGIIKKSRFKPPHFGFHENTSDREEDIMKYNFTNNINKRTRPRNQKIVKIRWDSVLEVSSSDDNESTGDKNVPMRSNTLNRNEQNQQDFFSNSDIKFMDSNQRVYYKSNKYQGVDFNLENKPKKLPGLNRRKYNWDFLHKELVHGLGEASSHYGEVDLKIKFGKIFYIIPNLNVNKKIWDYTSINDIVMNQYKSQTYFFNCLSEDESVILKVKNFLSNVITSHKVFELKGMIKQMNNNEMKPIKIYISYFTMQLIKVISSKHYHTKINWSSLDRKLDFQISLSTRVLLPVKLKWIKTFLNSFTCNPKDQSIAYKNIPGILKINSIKLKTKEGFKLTENIGCDLNRIEVYNLIKEDDDNKVNGYLDHNHLPPYYQLETYHRDWSKYFQGNKGLLLGERVQWQPLHILGDTQENVKLLEVVKTSIRLVEQIEREV
ncbi:hypothetical protein K502DRAFT_342437 [Neoconidiobolus thromboides FSU 785]|nr:hypothetical protein K502DRAFT_342437 [Neoconidiobolus thromboides FSU 785]